MNAVRPDAGSFRDRGGRVWHAGNRVFRTVRPSAVADYDFVRSTGLIDALVERGWLLGERVVDPMELGDAAADATYLLEHPKLPFLSWPYEWPFAALRSAALLQLDIHLTALERGVTLSDATAYNVQFRGCRPVFIDHLAFRRYVDGEFWMAHRQFCEQYLNPLLLRALTGVAYQPWYRGALEGITAAELNSVLSLRAKLSWNVITHVTLQARLQAGSTEADALRRLGSRKLPLTGFREMLGSLRRWIARLEPGGRRKSNWQDYARDNSYESAEQEAKRDFVRDFARQAAPAMLWDLGCNTGDYAAAALDAGARAIVGFDFDDNAVDAAFRRACEENLEFLPLVVDALNPSPAQGWLQAERAGVAERAPADAVLALALVHHLVVGRNARLDQVLSWITDMAPQGVIEFVPKSDPMVQRLLALRSDQFYDYDEAGFRRLLEQRSEIVREKAISRHGRRLFWYRHHD